MISARRRTLGLRLRGWFTQRLPAKIAALVLALLLWLVVTLQAPAEQWMEVRLDLSVDSGYALADAPPPKVRVLVEGRGRDLLELATARPVAHMEAADAGGDVAVIAFAASDIEFPAGVDARVRDVRPRVVRLKLKRVP
jgi:hypothetical protein